MSSIGFPDGQRITQWLGSVLVEEDAHALGAGTFTVGPFNLASWASVVVACKPTGGNVTVTVKQTISGGPVALELDTTFVVLAGNTLFESIVLFGDVVTVTFTGSAVGETLAYAVYPANTTTNAQVIASATTNFQHNEVLVAAEQALDFVDAGANVWTVTDDAANTRVKVSGPRIVTGRINTDGSVAGGSGFMVVKNATGDFTVTFTPAFATVPVVFPATTDGTNRATPPFAISAGQFRTIIETYAGAAIDETWEFIAIGCL